MAKEKEVKEETKEVAVVEDKSNDLTQGMLPGLEAFAEFKQHGQPITGLEELDATDLKMPKIKLCQSTSAEVGDEKCKAGQFYNVSTNEAMDFITCRLLAIGKSKVKWPENFKRGELPLCRSFDGLEGIEESTGEVKKCDSCPDCKWEGNEKPSCRQAYMWLGVLADNSPFRITMSGTSISKTKDLLTKMAQNGLPPFVYEMKIGSEKQKNDSGTYYITTYEITGTIEPKEFQGLKEMCESMQDMFLTARKKDILDESIATEDGDGKGIF